MSEEHPGWAGRRFAAVLFDLDGTLVDSRSAVTRSWLAWAGEQRLDPRRLVGWHGVPAEQIVRRLVAPEQFEAARARIMAIELDDLDGVVPLPGAVAALAALPEHRRAVVTSCTAPLAAARIGAARLAPPAVVVTADDVRRGKPDPEPFLLGARRLGVDPADCLVVEDAVSGITAATAAGMASLAVLTTTPREQLSADVVVPDLSHVRLVDEPDGVRVAVL